MNNTQMEKMIIEKQKGYTTAEVIAKFDMHARPAREIAVYCDQYKEREIYLESEIEINCKSLMGVLSAGILKGEKIRIKVEGIDSKAEEIATRLYNALSIENDREIHSKLFDIVSCSK